MEESIRHLVAESTGSVAPPVVELLRDSFGRPRLRRSDGGPMPDFSISHRPEIVAVALHSNGRVGIDVETVAAAPSAELRADVLTPAERAHFPASNTADGFCVLWTAKEAILKAVGQGLGFGMAQVELAPDGDDLSVAKLRGSAALAQGWRVWTTPLELPSSSARLAVAWGG